MNEEDSGLLKAHGELLLISRTRFIECASLAADKMECACGSRPQKNTMHAVKIWLDSEAKGMERAPERRDREGTGSQN